MSESYSEILDKADQAVAQTAATLGDDPQRPAYHLFTAANWINDPNGPCYYKGHWHMFFQHNPYIADFGPMGWGHVRSRDLVHWEHCPHRHHAQPGQLRCRWLLVGQRGHSRWPAHYDLFRRR